MIARLMVRLALWLRPVQPDVTSPEEKRQRAAAHREDERRLRLLRNEADLIQRRVRGYDPPDLH
jgi:hypothetical protein